MSRIPLLLNSGDRGPSVVAMQVLLRRLVQASAPPFTAPRSNDKHLRHLNDEMHKAHYGVTTVVLVEALKARLGLREASAGVDEKVMAALRDHLREHEGANGRESRDEEADLIATGSITYANGMPAAGAVVTLFDVDLRSTLRLGEDRADGSGRYWIAYSAEQFAAAEKGSADLRVEVRAPNARTAAASDVHFNVGRFVEINVQIPATGRHSLFAQVEMAIRPVLNDVEAHEREENDKHSDVTFLAGETALSAELIARYAVANRLAKRTLDAQFWFALLQDRTRAAEGESLGARTEAFLDDAPKFGEETVRKLLRSAVAGSVIEADDRTLDAWLEQYRKFSTQAKLGEDQKATLLGGVLADAGVSPEQREAVAQEASPHGRLSPDAIEKLRAAQTLSDEQADDLKTSLKLAELTGGDLALVRGLRKDFGLKRPADIARLARVEPAEFERAVSERLKAGEATLPIRDDAVAKEVGSPISGAYAASLHRQVVTAFPTAAFGGSLERAAERGPVPGLQRPGDVARVLREHPEIDLLHTRIDETLGEDQRVEPEVRAELKSVQRVFKLAPSFDSTSALLADGLHSAQGIYRVGESEFVRRYEGAHGFDRQAARRTWNRAADTHAAVLTVVADLQAMRPDALPAVLKGNTQALKQFPNWDSLFKAGDLCDCEHCRSVLSPAAYFADALMFLRDRKGVNPANSLKDLLLARRPDLGFIELNCHNALRTLPYIDIVCEVLERAVAGDANDLELVGLTGIAGTAAADVQQVRDAFTPHGIDLGEHVSLSQIDPTDPDAWIVHGDARTFLLVKKTTPNFFARVLPNSHASAEEMRAYPQYVDPHAYTPLRSAQHPFVLPFDLFGDEVRAALRKAKVERWQLMELYRSSNAPNDASPEQIAAEYFAIAVDSSAPTDEFRLITTAAPADAAQRDIWGEAGAGWLGTVANVKVFLNKTGLSYVELAQLLDLPFVNPNGDLAIHHEDASCDLDKKSIENLDAANLDRIHRFLRLWRKLDDWTLWQLDHVLRHPAIGDGDLDADFVLSLFYFTRIMKRLGKRATIEHVALLFGDLNTRANFTESFKKRGAALYQSLFLNARLIERIDPAFALDPGTQDVAPGNAIADHRPPILAALGVSEGDLVSLEDVEKPSDGLPYLDGDLSVANLSFLMRHAWLAKTLRYSISDWLVMLRLHAQDLERFASPQSAWEWLEREARLRATGLSVAELDWVASANRASSAATKEADAARFLTGLRSALSAIRAEFDPARYPFLTAVPPTDTAALGELLDTVLGRLGRSDQEALEFQQALAGNLRVTASVAGLPAGFHFPPAIAGAIPIRYHESNQQLEITGWMSAAEHTTLLTDPSLAAVTGIASYQAAIDVLFARARLVLKFFETIFTVPLAALPAAVDFAALDPDLRARVGYDPERRELSFRGLMSAAERAALEALSADADYRNAVNALATLPGLVAAPDPRIWLDDAALALPLVDNLAENRALAIERALPYLVQRASVDQVVQLSAAALGLPQAHAQWLLSGNFVAPGPLLEHLMGVFAGGTGVVDYSSDPATFDAWFWTLRVALLCSKWRIELTEAQQLEALAAAGDMLQIADLPLTDGADPASLDELVVTHGVLALRDAVPEWDAKLLDVLERLLAGEYGAHADLAAALVRVNERWAADDIETLLAALDAAFPADYANVAAVKNLVDGLALAGKLHATVRTALTLAAPTMSSAEAQTVQGLLRGKYGADSWLQLSGEVQDELRERKRTALAAYLLSQPQPANAPTGKWETTNDLYAYYLLDVEMQSCQLTSRLVQATGSVQLYVQRCFMGLEPDVQVVAHGDDGDSAWHWWKWMRKYRVWEANRKVFLWPENWIEPELKKDRSPFFKELENELMQNEVSQETAEDAFIAYLEKLDGVAQLEIAGFYQEDDADETILHVFGRNRGTEPHSYFYRTYDYRQWTPWEKIDLEIHGDYLIPAVINRRLFLFWPVFTEIPDESANNASVPIPSEGDTSAPLKPAMKRLRMQMAMSNLRSGQWTPKMLSKEYAESSAYSGQVAKQHYEFFPVDQSGIDDRFGIKFDGHSILNSGSQGAFIHGTFELTGCSGLPEIGHLPGHFEHLLRPETASVGSLTRYARWRELGSRTDAPENDLTLVTGVAAVRVLVETPWTFFITPPWHLSYLDRLLNDGMGALSQFTDRQATPVGSWLPFFYNDRKRTFFVLPTLVNLRRDGETVLGVERAYYPQVKEFFKNSAEFFEGIVRTWAESIDLAAMDPTVRANAEQMLHAQLGGEITPPYTDDQLVDLLVRFFMRFVNLYLGMAAAYLFALRQFHFKNYYHPFVCDFAKLVRNPLKGVPELMRRETQLMQTPFRFQQSYKPTAIVLQHGTLDYYPVENVDFSPDGAYSSYNWELFYHAPLHIANSLSRNQRFEEAREWYHFIFNPLGTESAVPGGSAMSKFWITKPFFETTDPQYVQQRIDNIMHMIAGDTSVPGYSPDAVAALEEQVRDWRVNPFEPHRLANYRTVAYQKTVVMKYLDNLIAWGDNLFRQDSMESINEATQLYILAAEILGPRPKKVSPQARPAVQSFNELELDFDAFSNALVEAENLVPALPGSGEGGSPSAPPLPMLYFCIPHNDIMLGYWTTVEDRLRKIRNCMNIDGVVRSLALFEPPIDPAALVKAVAGGMDIGAAIGSLNAPQPLYRFSVILQLANQMTADVRALGGALLAALEKKDAEAFGNLRQSHEIRALDAAVAVRMHAVDEAKEALDGLKLSKELVEIKRGFYSSRDFMNAGEIVALTLNGVAAALHIPVSVGYIAAGVLKAIPNFLIGASGFGGSPHATAETGGGAFGDAAKLAIQGLAHIAMNLEKIAGITGTVAAYQRRQDDWDFQADLALKEIEQVQSSIVGAEIRIEAAERELDNHRKQILDSKDVAAFMQKKYTNEELYQWQISQISSVYFQSYKLAYDLAKRAERCFRFELGLASSDYIKFGYWDSLRKGLMSGEQIQYDLRRLENAYIEENRREFELMKHVSLAMLDPLALVKLRETGRCFLNLPEEIFDHDFPGHYFRRIKSVSLSIPSVVGPYTTLACTLRLLKNSVRVNTLDGDAGYARNVDDDGNPADDERFIENQVPRKSVAISSGTNDSGLFELNFKGDRYLPFEGSGVVSGWVLELFNDENDDFGRPLRQFDYSTISDVVMHLKYTAREDAGPFKAGVVEHLREYFEADGSQHSLRILNLRDEFGSAWRRFTHPTVPADGNVFELEASHDLFYQRDAGKTLKINALSIIVRGTDAGDYSATLEPPFPAGAVAMPTRDDVGGLHVGELDVSAADIEIEPSGPPTTWRLRIRRPGGGNLTVDAAGESEIRDFYLILAYEWE